MLINIISWTATISSLIGQFLINKQNKIAFPIWVLSNILWIIVNILGTFNTANVVMYVVYTLLNVHGWIMWNKSKEEIS